LPVGLTGWAQINGLRGGEASITERSRFDNQYVEHWSPWRDFVIVVRTLLEVVRGSESEKPPSR
jgi:lipopolysaccharide/colanic/teichoic acid biosynthesis glycosyltransferase